MPRLSLMTAGESHGPAIVAVVNGVPAGLTLEAAWIDAYLARRQRGHGSGGRMQIEQDRVEILGGVRGSRTIGSPVALLIRNKDDTLDSLPPVTRPRPGHADLPGMFKYGTRDARDVLERSSARETAARVAGGAVAAAILDALGVRVCGYVVEIGPVAVTSIPAHLDDVVQLRDASPLQCPDPLVADAMIAEIDAAAADGDTVGGVIEVVARGMPAGVGGYAQPEDRLDGRLGAALLRIQAMKGVSIGLGFEAARRRGSDVHDGIARDDDGRLGRTRNHAGGIEGGMTTGEEVLAQVAMKPISTLKRPLQSVDVETGEAVEASYQRSDVCAVHRASVVVEAVTALVLADALLEKTGGDSMAEVRRNLEAYRRASDELLGHPPS